MTFTPSNLTLEDISINQKYNVHKKDNFDMFNHDFVGTAIQITATNVIVEDQEGECFTVDVDQLTPNTDEVMSA